MKIIVSWKGGQPDSEVELADDGSDLLSALARAHEAAMTKKKATATTASKKKKGTTAGSRKSLPTKRQEAESANSSRTFPEPAADVEEAHGPLLGGAMHHLTERLRVDRRCVVRRGLGRSLQKQLKHP
jgi:hypothetical protein